MNGNDKDIKGIYKHKHELEDAMNYWQEDNFANWYLSVKKNINIDIFREFMCREI